MLFFPESADRRTFVIVVGETVRVGPENRTSFSPHFPLGGLLEKVISMIVLIQNLRLT